MCLPSNTLSGDTCMEDILRESDFVTLHMPVLPETRGIINRKTLNMMKPSAYLINTSRGALVQEEDLCEALKSGTIRGAALDVFEMEPTGNRALFELKIQSSLPIVPDFLPELSRRWDG